MKFNRIYTPQPLSLNTTVCLEDQAAQHVAKVLRLKIGDKLHLFNGEGGAWLSEIIAIQKKFVTAQTLGFLDENNESPLYVALGQGICRGEKMDFIIQKATELGLTEFTPILIERTQFNLNGERLQKKIIHWQRVAISACEQCGRNKIPIIHQPTTLQNWLENQSSELNLILHPHTTQNDFSALKPKSVSVLVGSEGGFNEQEVATALQKKFIALKLGPRILRTETAPIAILSVTQHLWGDFNPSRVLI